MLLRLDHRVPDPVFEVPPDELDSVEVGGTRREEEHSHSQVSQKLDYFMRMMSSVVIEDYHRIVEHDLSRQVLYELVNAIGVGRPRDAVVKPIIMTTYGPQNSQAPTPLRILVEEKWIIAILPHMGLPVPLVHRCLIKVNYFHSFTELAD